MRGRHIPRNFVRGNLRSHTVRHEEGQFGLKAGIPVQYQVGSGHGTKKRNIHPKEYSPRLYRKVVQMKKRGNQRKIEGRK